MRKCKFILLLITGSLFLSYYAKAQETIVGQDSEGKRYTFKIVETSVDNMNDLYLNLTIASLFIKPGAGGAFGFNAAYLPTSKLLLQGDYHRPYVKDFDFAYLGMTDNTTFPTDAFKTYSNLNLGGTYYFHTAIKERNLKMGVGAQNGTNLILQTRMPIERRFGARFGYQFIRGAAMGEGTISVDSLPLSAVPANSGGRGTIDYYGSGNHNLYLGFTLARFQNFGVDSKKLGYARRSGIRNIYLDVMLPVASKEIFFNDITKQAIDYDYARFSLKPGWRLGYELIGNASKLKHFNISWGIEFGSRPHRKVADLDPGLVNGGGFFLLKFAMGYSGRVKPTSVDPSGRKTR